MNQYLIFFEMFSRLPPNFWRFSIFSDSQRGVKHIKTSLMGKKFFTLILLRALARLIVREFQILRFLLSIPINTIFFNRRGYVSCFQIINKGILQVIGVEIGKGLDLPL